MKCKTIFVVFSVLFVTNHLWAEGTLEGRNARVHPGARMILEKNGYKFDTNNIPISYNNRSIARLSDQTNSNPHSFDKNTIYITNFDVNQWVDKSILATSGNAAMRQLTNEMSMNAFNFAGFNGTRIFIQNVPDRFIRKIGSSVKNAFLAYIGAQNFQMADGSLQVIPVFQFEELFEDTVSQAISLFNSVFESGIYKEEDGYQYSRIDGRTFGRDKATKKELHEWNGNQWIVLIGE
jgi:hypothetical protein